MKRLILFCILFTVLHANGQKKKADSLPFQKDVKFSYSSLILPAGLITYGILGIKNDPIRKWDRNIRTQLQPDGVKTGIDDYTVLAPILTTFGLEFAGIEGRNNLVDKSIIIGTSALFMYSTVRLIKNNTSVRRPSGRSVSSFPSGHTALSFMAAEFLHQEYGHVSPWYSIAGYSVATATGFLRIYNDKHWFSDVLAGAGIGILSTKIAYWLHPFLKNVIFKNKTEKQVSQVQWHIAPLYSGNELLLTTSLKF
ncbi:phosphatase PAP2 family protein [Nonlabens sp.]|jgi:membrane-associated phospholipid phosphatase|uniref:phosphatase PAP2 family protein n=1 Tax=Nonlabens sp. TaxID=1888209 RepID=UPI003F69926D